LVEFLDSSFSYSKNIFKNQNKKLVFFTHIPPDTTHSNASAAIATRVIIFPTKLEKVEIAPRVGTTPHGSRSCGSGCPVKKVL
jgi:hypothetical protein